jgi:hypothetical protein
MTTSADDMLTFFTPFVEAALGLDLTRPDDARAELERRLPAGGPEAEALTAELLRSLAAGELCQRGELPMRWGRVSKATPESRGFSIDVVHMNGSGPRHRHPQGEVNFCIATEGEPTFDGHGPGWVVFAPETVHVPTVAGGLMLIVYLLPQGAMELLPS